MSKKRGIQMRKSAAKDWRDERIAELEAQLLTLGAYTSSGMHGTVQLVAQLTRERNSAQEYAYDVAHMLNDELESAKNELAHVNQRIEMLKGWIEPACKDGNQPCIVGEILRQINHAEEMSGDKIAEIRAELEKLKTLDAQVYPGAALLWAMRIKMLVAQRWVSVQLIQSALRLSNVPELVCDDICRELRLSHKIEMKWLEKLGEKWFQQNIPSAPAKLSTIKEWLELSAEFRASGQYASDFALKRRFDRKQITRAEQLREEIEELARNWQDKTWEYIQRSNLPEQEKEDIAKRNGLQPKKSQISPT